MNGNNKTMGFDFQMFGQKPVYPAQMPQVYNQALSQSAANPKPESKGFLKNLMGGIGDVLKSAAPVAASFIPGVGPIASQILSTMNDDEWFEGFPSAGATFNEYLALNKVSDFDAANQSNRNVKGLSVMASAVSYPTTFGLYNPDGTPSEVEGNIMPTVLAHIRQKTNNVLVDDTSLYTLALDSAVKLYALYYQGEKYIKLCANLPLNIPRATAVYGAIDPRYFSTWRGAVENLRDYLKTSVRIPHALSMYLRWRFGTVFHSDNTGKPGLVTYDYTNPFSKDYSGEDRYETPLDKYLSAIENQKARFVSAGRAGADLFVGYSSHTMKYDVEDAHYDEKEFCLRINLLPLSDTNVSAPLWDVRTGFNAVSADKLKFRAKAPFKDTCALYLDSRISNSPGVQAVTMSVPTSQTLFPVISSPEIAIYLLNDVEIPCKIGSTTTLETIAGNKWYVAEYNYNQAGGSITESSSAGISTVRNWISGWANVAQFKTSFIYFLCGMSYESLQLHNTGAVFGLDFAGTGLTRTLYLSETMLSYDLAILTPSQVEAIQRQAARNLIRGDYTQKKSDTAKPEVKAAITEVKEVVAEALKAPEAAEDKKA